MKTIVVTGCSHSAGTEMSDKMIFEDYKKFLSDAKKLSFTEIQRTTLKKRLEFLLKKFKKKSLKSKIVNTNKTGNLTSRYFRILDRSLSWPARLQKKLPGCKVINLAKHGTSFKHSVKEALDIIKKHGTDLIFVHQVPATERTYVKRNRKMFDIDNISNMDYKKNLYRHNEELLASIYAVEKSYKNLIRRDVRNNYFNRVLARHHKLLLSRATESVKHFYILEETSQEKIFANENIIIKNFNEFRKRYQIGRSHVIQDDFNDDVSELVIKKIWQG